MVNDAKIRMMAFYGGNLHDIDHFIRVNYYADLIARIEKLDAGTCLTVALSSIVHDISCPLCRKKYGKAEGKLQEKESDALVREFLKPYDLLDSVLERICYIVSHHHSPERADGIDFQIIIEADAIANAEEADYSKERIISMRNSVFRTEGGIRVLDSIFCLGGRDE